MKTTTGCILPMLCCDLCRWPLAVRGRAAGAELGGFERDPAGAAGSCYI